MVGSRRVLPSLPTFRHRKGIPTDRVQRCTGWSHPGIMHSRRGKTGSQDPWEEVFAFVTECKAGTKERMPISPICPVGATRTLILKWGSGSRWRSRNVVAKRLKRLLPIPGGKSAPVSSGTGRLMSYSTIHARSPSTLMDRWMAKIQGRDTSKPPIHTLTIFANPLLQDRPDPDSPYVHAVKPGEIAPAKGN